MELTTLQTNVKKEEDGVSVPFGDATIVIRSRASLAYRAVMKDTFKQHESSIALGVMPEEKLKDLMYQANSKGLVIGWSGITEGGEEVPYSPEKAYAYLRDVSAFRNFVDENADKLDNFRDVKESQDVKNS